MKKFNLLSKDECLKLLHADSYNGFQRSLIFDDHDLMGLSVKRKSHSKTLSNNDTEDTLSTLHTACENYISQKWNLKLSEWSSPVINRYCVGDYYEPHTDTNSGHACRRAFSCVTFLNDNFGGGELYFPHRDKNFNPKAGVSILFAADELHGSSIVRYGTKFSMVQWILYPAFLCDS